jgi:hypothetical protein
MPGRVGDALPGRRPGIEELVKSRESRSGFFTAFTGVAHANSLTFVVNTGLLRE